MLLGDVAEGNVRNRRTYQKIGKGFALAVTNITDMTAFKGIQSYVTSTGASSDAKKIFIENNYGQSINSSTDVSISVPPEIREKSKRTSMVTVFLVYFNLKLFQGKQKLSSEVMSAEMRTEKFRDLSSPVIITFKKDNLTSMNKKPLCAWFDFQKSGK